MTYRIRDNHNHIVVIELPINRLILIHVDTKLVSSCYHNYTICYCKSSLARVTVKGSLWVHRLIFMTFINRANRYTSIMTFTAIVQSIFALLCCIT